MKKSDDPKYQIQALTKGLTILECFKDVDEYGVTELGQLVNLPDSSVQRVINTLELMGYLFQNPANRKYRLSPKILRTFAKCGNFLKWREQARKHMVHLNEQFGESVNLAVRDQDKCSYIELVESKHLLRPNFTLNDSYPLYCTSLGRSLLCDLPDDLIMAILPETLEPLTPFTIVDKKKVLEKIKDVKTLKYAVDDEEFYLGLCCVGGPVFAAGARVIAAISITGPKVRMTAKVIEDMIPAVVETTRKISQDYDSIILGLG